MRKKENHFNNKIILSILLDHVIKQYQKIVIHNKFHHDFCLIMTMIKLINTNQEANFVLLILKKSKINLQ